MNFDKGYSDLSSQFSIKIDNLPSDYFYNNEYEYLTIPEAQLLLTLSEKNVSYTFSGLKKKTKLHQYRISKSLKRLQDRELITKDERGTYSLTNEGMEFTKNILYSLINKERGYKAFSSERGSTKLLVYFYPQVKLSDVVTKLSGRWFSSFRFIYIRELADHSIELCWEDDENNQIILSINDKRSELEYRYYSFSSDKIQLFINWISKEMMTSVNTEMIAKSRYKHIDDHEIYN